MSKYIIFDNGGKTSDRFTIINKETGDVFGSGENPGATNGTWKCCGNCADPYIILPGAGWRRRLPVKKVIKAEVENYVNNARLDKDWIGTEVEFDSLPAAIREHILHLDSSRYSEDHSKANVVYMSRSSEGVKSGS